MDDNKIEDDKSDEVEKTEDIDKEADKKSIESDKVSLEENKQSDIYDIEDDDEDEDEVNRGRKDYISGVITGGIVMMAVAAVIIFVIVLVLGSKIKNSYSFGSEKTATTKTVENSKDEIISKIEFLSSVIDKYSLYDIDDKDVIEGIYTGIFNSFDDKYAKYYSAEEFEKFSEQSSGNYSGIGAYITQDTEKGTVYIASPMKGTPAEKAGLREGDIIVKVDDKEITDQDSEEVVSWIKGKEGTDVTMKIYREGEKDFLTFKITRKSIEVPTVTYEMLEDNIGYIGITEFDEITESQFKKGILELKDKGAKGVIIDLRSNPGGNVSTVVNIIDMFLSKGKMIVYTEDKKGNTLEKYMSKTDKLVDMKITMLINGNSASASEIFAGAVQDYGLGKLVGTTSYGKGIVQSVIPLNDGSAIKLTTSKYYTPNGRNIHEKGIDPDVKIEFDADKFYDDKVDNQKNKALQIIKQELIKK